VPCAYAPRHSHEAKHFRFAEFLRKASTVIARRVLYAASVLVLCAWVLVPIYLVALGAFGGRLGGKGRKC
jgi:hypothetical protein